MVYHYATLKACIGRCVCVLVCDVVPGLWSRCLRGDTSCTRSCQHLRLPCVCCALWAHQIEEILLKIYYYSLFSCQKNVDICKSSVALGMPRWPLVGGGLPCFPCFAWDCDPYPEACGSVKAFAFLVILLLFLRQPEIGKKWSKTRG